MWRIARKFQHRAHKFDVKLRILQRYRDLRVSALDALAIVNEPDDFLLTSFPPERLLGYPPLLSGPAECLLSAGSQNRQLAPGKHIPTMPMGCVARTDVPCECSAWVADEFPNRNRPGLSEDSRTGLAAIKNETRTTLIPLSGESERSSDPRYPWPHQR